LFKDQYVQHSENGPLFHIQQPLNSGAISSEHPSTFVC
jgi:hypothetical protein